MGSGLFGEMRVLREHNEDILGETKQQEPRLPEAAPQRSVSPLAPVAENNSPRAARQAAMAHKRKMGGRFSPDNWGASGNNSHQAARQAATSEKSKKQGCLSPEAWGTAKPRKPSATEPQTAAESNPTAAQMRARRFPRSQATPQAVHEVEQMLGKRGEAAGSAAIRHANSVHSLQRRLSAIIIEQQGSLPLGSVYPFTEEQNSYLSNLVNPEAAPDDAALYSLARSFSALGRAQGRQTAAA